MLKPKARVQIVATLANRLEHETQSFTASGRTAIQSDMEQKIVDTHWENEIQSALIAKILQKKPGLRKKNKELSYHDHILEFRLG